MYTFVTNNMVDTNYVHTCISYIYHFFYLYLLSNEVKEEPTHEEDVPSVGSKHQAEKGNDLYMYLHGIII